jgi:hypothetical protein
VRGNAVIPLDDDTVRLATGKDYSAPVGPHGRVILAIGADKINTPRLLGW